MELQRTIMSGDLNGLRQLEHQILEHVNHVYEDAGNGNDDEENFTPLTTTAQLAAWRTGHRLGASPQAWGYARVHSFATKGKTYYTTDKDLR